MQKYFFRAKDLTGSHMEGEVLAENEEDALRKIRGQKVIPIKVESGALKKRKKEKTKKIKVKSKELQIFTRQFSVLIASGVPIVESLQSISRGAKTNEMKSVLSGVYNAVKKGSSLTEAMSLYERSFGVIYINLIRAGEEGGVLDETLDGLAHHLEKSAALRRKIIGALVYPVGILCFSLLVTFGLLTFVVPKFEQMFVQNSGELPALTQAVILLSDFCLNYWYLFILFGVGFLSAITFSYRTTKGRKKIDQILINTPLVGLFLEKASIARTSRTFAILLRSGVKINDCLKICAAISGNWVWEKIYLDTEKNLLKGETLSRSFSLASKRIPTMVLQMISIGEEGGSLDFMLEKVAIFYEDEVDSVASTLSSVLEPVLLVFLGILIAFIVISMYLPIFQMASTVA